MLEPIDRMPEIFVGRNVELRQLYTALHQCVGESKPQFVLVEGDFGVGKTALINHFTADAIRNIPELIVGHGKCSMEAGVNGLIPFSQVLLDLTEKSVHRGVVVSKDLFEFVKEVAPAWLDIFTLGTASAIVKTGAKTVELGEKLFGKATYSQDNVFVQYSNALEQISRKNPIIVFIDDLQWADTSSLRLLFHLARGFQNRAAMFLCTYRPVEAMETGENAALFCEIRANLLRYGATEIVLQQGINVGEYVKQRYMKNMFPPEFIDSIQQATDGHALFVSQFFSLWEETKIIMATPDPQGQPVWGVTDSPDFSAAIPQTISAVLAERIRLMRTELQELMTLASVEGEDFTAQVLARLQRTDDFEIYDCLETLEDRYKLIQEQGSQELESAIIDFYRFAHRFFREYIYKQLSKGKRRLLHRQVGECLETLYPDQTSIAGQLTQHFYEAGEYRRAIKYAKLAAIFEQSRSVWAEGERWCEFGLQLIAKHCDDKEKKVFRLDFVERSGQGAYASGQYVLALERYQEAYALATQLQESPTHIAALCAALIEIYDELNQITTATEFLEIGRAVLKDVDTPTEAHIKLRICEGLIQVRLGNLEVAIPILNQALKEAASLEQTLELARAQIDAYDILGIALGNINQYQEATDAFQSCVRIAQSIDDKRWEADCLLNLASDYVDRRMLDEAESVTARALQLSRQIGDQDHIAYARASKGYILISRKMYAEAVSETRWAIETCEKFGSVWNLPYAYTDLARAQLGLGDLSDAEASVRKALSYTHDGEFVYGYVLETLARIEAKMQRWDPACMHFEHAINIYQKAGHLHGVARTKCGFAESLIEKGDLQQASVLLSASLTEFERLDLISNADEIREMVTQLECTSLTTE